jgi:hypothetical protein
MENIIRFDRNNISHLSRVQNVGSRRRDSMLGARHFLVSSHPSKKLSVEIPAGCLDSQTRHLRTNGLDARFRYDRVIIGVRS